MVLKTNSSIPGQYEMAGHQTNGKIGPNAVPKVQPRIEPYPLSGSDLEAIQNVVSASHQRPLLEGSSSIIHGIPSVHFRISEQWEPELTAQKIFLIPWRWRGTFGVSVTLTLAIKKQGPVSRVSVYSSDATYPGLDDGRFLCTFVRRNMPIGSYLIDYNTCPESLTGYRCFLSEGSNAPVLFDDRDAHFWEVQGCLESSFSQLLSRKDKLGIGWAKSFKSLVHRASAAYRELESVGLPGLTKADLTPPSEEFLAFLKCEGFHLKRVLSRLGDLLCNNERSLEGLFRDFTPIAKQGIYPKLSNVFVHSLFCLQQSPALTKCGRRLPWLDGRSVQLKTLDIDPDQFPSEFPPEEYWPRLPEDYWCNWGYMLNGEDIPISPSEMTNANARWPLADDADEVIASADALLDEAMTSQKWTIPPRAVVELEVGPFSHMELHDFGHDEILFVLRNRNDEFYIVWLDYKTKRCSFRVCDDVDETTAKRAIGAVKLLLAAIIRDFWVVEEREKVFATKEQRHRKQRADDDSPLIIYLPRIRYLAQPNLAQCERDLGQQEKRAHYVQPHLRKSENPSQVQLILAERYGFSVPIGYTFVRPHERGKQKRDIIYRSRSALRSLYEVIDVREGAGSDWFRFERDAYKLMEALGFSVEHIARSRRGDSGVDVYATKGDDLDQVNWIIQCKCYALQRKVGPGVIRELAGALCQYPAGTKGMVVTTSVFTASAKQEALAHGIRLIDGNEFAQLLKSSM